jgi:hypothetical protein
VARIKQTVTQRNMSMMEIREDFLEADDLELRMASLRGAKNMRALATRVVECRPGTFYRRTLDDADDVIEIRPASGVAFGIIINDTSLDVIDTRARVVHTEASVPWSDATGVWVEPFRDKTIIGGAWGLYTLTYASGAWSFAPFEFSTAAGAELAQPYWAYEQSATIQPSARTGSITLTASAAIWTSGYVGLRIRYGSREVLITDFISSTVMRGDVVSTLPPTFDIVLNSASDFRVGDAVIGVDTNFQGLVVAVSSLTITVVTTAFFDGPDVSEKLTSPTGSAIVSSVTEVSPAASPVWDEPLMSSVRGYPQSAAAVSGRFVLLDFPLIPDLVATSSARSIFDWEVGLDDDDAIVRQVGDNAPRFLHAVNAGDLLLFSDRGCYYLPTRDNGVLTPSNFNLVRFDQRAASPIKPVAVDDGVVFVEASGESIAAALLDGNVYLKWSVRALTTFHNQLIHTPKKLCGPALSSAAAEKYLFVVNGDGTLAAVSWNESLGGEQVGFAPWDTDGDFINVTPLFGAYWCIVDREIDGVTTRFLEEFSDEAFLDCAVLASAPSQFDTLSANNDTFDANGDTLTVLEPVAQHLAGNDVQYGGEDFYAGTFTVNSDGSVAGEPDLYGEWQIGLGFQSIVSPWPMELLNSERLGMVTVRVIRFGVSVQATSQFTIMCNGNSRSIGGYAFGDDLSERPPLRTQIYRMPVMGRRDHPELAIIKDKPGRFRILAMTQEVQG